MSLLRITAGIISQPASGSPLRPPWPTGPSLRAGYSVRSSPPLRPDPPVSPAPPDFTSSAYIGGPARQLGLGCERHLPCFGSVFPPHVPSPLRREENQGPIPALRPCSMAFPTKTVSRLLQCSRHRLPSGPFARRFSSSSPCAPDSSWSNLDAILASEVEWRARGKTSGSVVFSPQYCDSGDFARGAPCIPEGSVRRGSSKRTQHPLPSDLPHLRLEGR